MKKIFLLNVVLLIITAVFSCKADDDIIITQDSIIGTWKLTEFAYSIGGPLIWQNANSDYNYAFFEDGTFSSTVFKECTTGTYVFDTELDILVLEYDCEDFSSQSENEDGEIVFSINFGSNYFILSPRSGAICIEGCPSKYEKQ